MNKFQFQIMLGIIAVFLVMLFTFMVFRKPDYNYIDPASTQPSVSYNLPVQVLVVDMDLNENRLVNEADVANGNAPILAILTAANEPHFIESFDELAALDTDHDGYIDLKTELQDNILAAYLQDNGQFKFVSLYKNGIYALFLDRKYIQNNLKNFERITKALNEVLLADNTRRPIVAVLVGQKILDKLKKPTN